jgi:hypothetical protein
MWQFARSGHEFHWPFTRKQFFFEKKTKKLFPFAHAAGESATAVQKFFGSFFQKRTPCLPAGPHPSPIPPDPL